MNTQQDLKDLEDSYYGSPYSSVKASNFFKIYVDLFAHLRGTPCTFIETGILDGGSLFMWRNWLGPQARIIGIDLNPDARRWEQDGFEIYIGDQGDPEFWQQTYQKIGQFDALLDDGGHRSFQQVVTLVEGLTAVKDQGIIVVEDTVTNYMKEFSAHGDYCFLNYAKTATDSLIAQSARLYPNDFQQIVNQSSVDLFDQVYSIQFFSNIVAFKIDKIKPVPAGIRNNKPTNRAKDYRYNGLTNSTTVQWPSPFENKTVVIKG